MPHPPPVALSRDTPGSSPGQALPARGEGTNSVEAARPTFIPPPLAGRVACVASREGVEAIITATRSWLGTPYLHQASLKGVACDCLGLVRGVWRDVYGEEPEAMPAYSPDWAEAGGAETLAEAARRNMEELAPQTFSGGDLLLFRWRPHLPAKHAAIAASRETMVHAQEGACVCEVAVTPWWRRRIAYAFRFRETRSQKPEARRSF